tara:strand:+ start:175 stop:426 length:252 start_codon:yes stop_codon:yes gene_type:complete
MGKNKKDSLKITDEKEFKKEMEIILQHIIKDAKNVGDDYKESPSELSGSILQIHEKSPILSNEYSGSTDLESNHLKNDDDSPS